MTQIPQNSVNKPTIGARVNSAADAISEAAKNLSNAAQTQEDPVTVTLPRAGAGAIGIKRDLNSVLESLSADIVTKSEIETAHGNLDASRVHDLLRDDE